MSAHIEAYGGDGEFVFVSYSHRDSQIVYPELEALQAAGVNVWFDEGIQPGHRWTDELAMSIDRCAAFLFFVTPNSVASQNCLDEVQYARGKGLPMVAVHLEATTLPPGLELTIANQQAILAHELDALGHRGRLLDTLNRWLADGSRRGALDTAAAPSTARGVAPSSWLISAAVAALGVVLALAFYGLFDDGNDPRPSVAVMPFNDYTNDSTGYLADGIADGLIGQLGSLSALRVASRSSAFALKQQLAAGQVRVEEISDLLAVQHIVEGSVAPGERADALVLSARLIDVRRDTPVWTGTHSTQTSSVIAIQGAMAEAIAAKLLQAEGTETVLAVVPETTVDAAYEPYLKGRAYLRRPNTAVNAAAALDSFNEALALDPNFARAYGGLCETHLSRYLLNRDRTPVALARKACAQALELSPDLWEVNLALSELHRLTGDYDAALQAVQAAVATRPDEAEVFSQLGWTRAERGENQAAEAAFLKAIELDPRFWRVYSNLAGFYYDRADYAAAQELFHAALELAPDKDPVLLNVSAARAAQGDYEGSLATLKKVQSRQQPPRRGTLTNMGINYYYMGCFEESAFWQGRAVAVAPNDHWARGRLAESCRFVAGFEAGAKAHWRAALELVAYDQNQASWGNRGVAAVYHAHLGETREAEAALAQMWAMSPEPAMAHFYEAIVAARAGDRDRQAHSVQAALAAGFNPTMLEHDPDLYPPRACTMAAREPVDLSACG